MMRRTTAAILLSLALFLTAEPDLPPEEAEIPPEVPEETQVEIPQESSGYESPQPQAEVEGASAFLMLSSYEAVVKNFTEFENALELDNGITTVYFGADITMQAGIRIHPKKTHVVVAGFNPLDAAQAAPYTLTDLDSPSFYDTVYIDAVGVKSLHIRDLTVVGKNYYGPFGVADLEALAGVSVTYERVDYSGPQLGYHRRGAVRFADCTARITGDNGIWAPNQEFSEVKHVTFGGVNTIDTATSTYTVFWHPYGGTFTLEDDAVLTVRSPDTSEAFGVFFADSYLNLIDITIGKCAVLDMTISGIATPALYSTIGDLVVKEIGAFRLTSTMAATAPILRVGGGVTVEEEAVFQITGNSSALLNLVGGSLICNNPSSVLFHNTNRDIRAETSAAQLSVLAQQVNYFDSLQPNSHDHPALYHWRREDEANLSLTATLAAGSSGELTKVDSNYDGTPAPSTANFSMAKARILAFGRLDLYVSEPTTHSTAINGVTAPGAVVRVSFSQGGVDYICPDVTADASGVFHVPVGVALAGGTVIEVKSAWQYLTAEATAEVRAIGELLFSVPPVIEFMDMEIKPFEQLSKRVNPDWKIIVSDTRDVPTGWNLYARLGRELAPVLGKRPPLSNAMVFVDDTGKRSVLTTDRDTLIMAHPPSGDVVTVMWEDKKGILAVIQPGTAFCDTMYTAEIVWTLVDAP